MDARLVQFICVVVVSFAGLNSCEKCSYTCRWPDIDRTFCDSRFTNIFRGVVRGVHKNSKDHYVDYAVEIQRVHRAQDTSLVSKGNTVTIRTTLHQYICPVAKMAVGSESWFGTGPVGTAASDDRIEADSCTSFVVDYLPPHVGQNCH